MPIKTKNTPGQQLWLDLLRADQYDQTATKIVPPPASPQEVSKRWLEGMSRSLKEKFSTGVRKRREELHLTQEQLAEAAGLTVTGVAMIERGERLPNLDTAARLCWALDVAAGVTAADL